MCPPLCDWWCPPLRSCLCLVSLHLSPFMCLPEWWCPPLRSCLCLVSLHLSAWVVVSASPVLSVPCILSFVSLHLSPFMCLHEWWCPPLRSCLCLVSLHVSPEWWCPPRRSCLCLVSLHVSPWVVVSASPVLSVPCLPSCVSLSGGVRLAGLVCALVSLHLSPFMCLPEWWCPPLRSCLYLVSLHLSPWVVVSASPVLSVPCLPSCVSLSGGVRLSGLVCALSPFMCLPEWWCPPLRSCLCLVSLHVSPWVVVSASPVLSVFCLLHLSPWVVVSASPVLSVPVPCLPSFVSLHVFSWVVVSASRVLSVPCLPSFVSLHVSPWVVVSASPVLSVPCLPSCVSLSGGVRLSGLVCALSPFMCLPEWWCPPLRSCLCLVSFICIPSCVSLSCGVRLSGLVCACPGWCVCFPEIFSPTFSSFLCPFVGWYACFTVLSPLVSYVSHCLQLSVIVSPQMWVRLPEVLSPLVSLLVSLCWMVRLPSPCCGLSSILSLFVSLSWVVCLPEDLSPCPPACLPACQVVFPSCSLWCPPSSLFPFLFPFLGWCARLPEALSPSLSLFLFPFVGWCVRLPPCLPRLHSFFPLLDGLCAFPSPCPVCLPACVPVCLPSCFPLLEGASTFLRSCLFCLPAWLPACFPACPPACLPACLPACFSLVPQQKCSHAENCADLKVHRAPGLKMMCYLSLSSFDVFNTSNLTVLCCLLRAFGTKYLHPHRMLPSSFFGI